MPVKDTTYYQWLALLKERIRSAQIKAALKVNAELIALYWQLGGEILKKEVQSEWGDKWLHQLSKDLINEFPEIKGFSHTNLKFIRRWRQFYNFQIGQQLVAQLPQGKNKAEKAPDKIVQPVTQTSEIAQQPVGQIGQQFVAQISQPIDPIPDILTTIPWGHHLRIITKNTVVRSVINYSFSNG